MDNVTALKSLYVAMGGKTTDYYSDIAGGAKVAEYNQIADVICAMAKIAVPAELPAVTSADAGAVLMVSEAGKWAVDYVPAELPEVSADDNGDMLKVVSGEWAKFTPEP